MQPRAGSYVRMAHAFVLKTFLQTINKMVMVRLRLEGHSAKRIKNVILVACEDFIQVINNSMEEAG